MSETTMSEDVPATTGNDESNPIYLTEENPHRPTTLLETEELSMLYTENTDSKTMSTSPENVSRIDEERSAADLEAMNITDNTDHKNSRVSQFKDNAEHNSASGANEDASLPPVDASDVEDLDRAPTSNIRHSDTTEGLDDTTNPDTGDVDISDDIDIEPYAVADEDDRVLTNPMYEADVMTELTADNTSDEHELQDPSNTNSRQSPAEDTRGDRKLQKLQSQPNMKALQPNAMYGGAYIPNQRAKDNSPIYRYCWLVIFVVFLLMVALIAAGILVGVYHNTQDQGSPTVPPMNMQGSGNWSTTFILMTESDDTNQTILESTHGTNQTSFEGANGLGTQQSGIVTFGGLGKVWKKVGLVCKLIKQRKYSKFNYVSGLAVSSTNEVFVSDNWNRRIQVFSMKGVFLRSFGTGKKRPQHIAMDQDDTLWVLLTGTKYKGRKKISTMNIDRYSGQGHVLARFRCSTLRNVKRIALDTLSDNIVITTDKGRGAPAGWFNKDSCKVHPFRKKESMWLKWPSSVTVDKKGNIFITENHNVFKYDKNGAYVCCFGRKGDEVDSHLRFPKGICVDSLGRIIVADNGNNRVEMFTAEGEYIRAIANITHPQRVAVGREGQLIVSSHTHYVTIFPNY